MGQRRVAVAIDIQWPYKYHVEAYASCQEYAAGAGWDCTINAFAEHAMKSGRRNGPYAGVLGRISPQLADAARRCGVPTVNISMSSHAEGLPSVFPDIEAAGAMAARHLMARGFRKFGLLGFLRDRSSPLYLKGFRSELASAGASCSTHRCAPNSAFMSRTWPAFIDNLSAWIDTWTTPIGIYVERDLMCRFLIDLCREKGLSVPHDVAIIGTGNEDVICASPPPTLSSIDLNYTQVGRQAAALLDRLMDGQEPPTQPQLVAPAALIPRQSTDSYAVSDPTVARALRFIAEHGHEAINVDDVAVAAHASRRSLQRRFQEATQRSITDEITRLRTERSKRRLVETDELLKNVAADSGFSNLNHFYRTFVRIEGISPKEYRKQYRRES